MYPEAPTPLVLTLPSFRRSGSYPTSSHATDIKELRGSVSPAGRVSQGCSRYYVTRKVSGEARATACLGRALWQAPSSQEETASSLTTDPKEGHTLDRLLSFAGEPGRTRVTPELRCWESLHLGQAPTTWDLGTPATQHHVDWPLWPSVHSLTNTPRAPTKCRAQKMALLCEEVSKPS